MKHKEPCGCTHDGREWLSECTRHKIEGDELHARAQRDHATPPKLSEPDWLALPAENT
jgi:hypothetical protein